LSVPFLFARIVHFSTKTWNFYEIFRAVKLKKAQKVEKFYIESFILIKSPVNGS